MRTLSITVSDELYNRLIHTIPARKVSKFVNEAVAARLEEKQNELYHAYLEASQDAKRESELGEWDTLNIESWLSRHPSKKETS